jgi:hypothetical protein
MINHGLGRNCDNSGSGHRCYGMIYARQDKNALIR